MPKRDYGRKEGQTTFTISLSVELLDKMKRLATEEGVPISQLAREAIDEVVRRRSPLDNHRIPVRGVLAEGGAILKPSPSSTLPPAILPHHEKFEESDFGVRVTNRYDSIPGNRVLVVKELHRGMLPKAHAPIILEDKEGNWLLKQCYVRRFADNRQAFLVIDAIVFDMGGVSSGSDDEGRQDPKDPRQKPDFKWMEKYSVVGVVTEVLEAVD